MTTLMVLAKAPVAGRSKPRLCPPCTPEQAASVAEAALRDTLDVAGRCKASRVVLVLDGGPLEQVDATIEVVPQRGGGLGERLAGAFDDVGGPALLIGMDTPQVDVDLLDGALARVAAGTSVIGPAPDGGWGALGLPTYPPGAFTGVPMSTAATARRQRARLRALGLAPAPLREVRDVDHWRDALLVADEAPDGRFARVVAAIERDLAVVSA